MVDLIDPSSNEPAQGKRKEELIKEYLINKFEKVTPLDDTTYPVQLIPNKDTIEYLRANADLRKTTGYDYIPYQALKYAEFRHIVLRDL